jgi:hypothetical protein
MSQTALANQSDLPQFLQHLGEFAADLTTVFLKHVGLVPPPGKCGFYPRAFLLDVGAAMQLLAWEIKGFGFHREAGFPPGDQVVLAMMHYASCKDASAYRDGSPLGSFAAAVLQLAIDRLAWAAQSTFDCDVALNCSSDDELAQALAEFLWRNRCQNSDSDEMVA